MDTPALVAELQEKFSTIQQKKKFTIESTWENTNTLITTKKNKQ